MVLSVRYVYVLRLVCILLLILAQSTCASRQAHIDELAAQAQLSRDVVTSDAGFSQLTYTNGAYRLALQQIAQNDSRLAALNVYLEGDGIPWIQPRMVAVDPTPKTALALKLMIGDENASLYLGRPCYHGFYQQPQCHPVLWTQARYSEIVISAMHSALIRKLERDAWITPNDSRQRKIRLIGYSGGGVIAMFMAKLLQEDSRFTDISVISIAANLDVDAWTAHHGFSRLTLSLNPATSPQHFSNVQQFHLYGERDENVPLRLVQPIQARFGNLAHWIIVPTADHACCWEKLWPDLQKQIQANE